MTLIENKKLGKLVVSPLGLGCANLSGLYGDLQEDASEIIKFAVDNGVTFFDTADAYAKGANEELIAESLLKQKINRSDIILSTKCGVVWEKSTGLSNSVDNSAAYIKSACEASLKRLNTDYIDIYYLHRIAEKGEGIEESMQTLRELISEGKIRHIGLSEVNADIIRKANAVYPLSAIQSEYSLMTRDPEVNGVIDICKELEIGFVAYSPLCRGLLSSDFHVDMVGKNNFRANLPRFRQENLENNIKIVKQIEELANDKKCSIVQLSLAWVLSRGEFISPIPGTKSIKHLRENIESTQINLTEEDMNLLDSFFPIGVASGDRYSAAILRSYNLTSDKL